MKDFDLHLDFKIEGGNSGIQYRSFVKPGKHDGWRIGGYQADFESGDRYSGICYGEGFRGILSDRGFHTTLTLNDKGKLQKDAKKFADSKNSAKRSRKRNGTVTGLPPRVSFRTLHQWCENDRIDRQR